jgi:hypothetical protein
MPRNLQDWLDMLLILMLTAVIMTAVLWGV